MEKEKTITNFKDFQMKMNVILEDFANEIIEIWTGSNKVAEILGKLTITANKLEQEIIGGKQQCKSDSTGNSIDNDISMKKDNDLAKDYIRIILNCIHSFKIEINTLKSCSSKLEKKRQNALKVTVNSDAISSKNETIDKVIDIGVENIKIERDDESLSDVDNCSENDYSENVYDTDNFEIRKLKQAKVILRDVNISPADTFNSDNKLETINDIETQDKIQVKTLRSRRVGNPKIPSSKKRKKKAVDSNKPFMCNQCHIGFASKRGLRDHQRDYCKVDKDIDMMECDECGIMCENKAKLAKHKKRQHISPGEFECQHCNKKYSNKRELKRHLTIHNEVTPYKCALPGCGESFITISRLASHYKRKSHLKSKECKLLNCSKCQKLFLLSETEKCQAHLESHQKQTEYFCEECGKTLFNRYAFVKHLENHFKQGTTHKCDMCDQVFDKISTLETHLNKVHDTKLRETDNALMNYRCDVCGRYFYRQLSLEVHKSCHVDSKKSEDKGTEQKTTDFDKKRSGSNMITIDSDKKTGDSNTKAVYRCELCGKKSMSVFNMNFHKKHCTGERRFKCKQCPKSFHLQYDLSKHLQIHLKRKNICPYDNCNEEFLNNHQLKRHLARHGQFKCTTCQKCFSSRSGLQVHETLHSGILPYSCDTCDKKFSLPGLLKAHVRVHVKEFGCEICGRMFSSTHGLNHHVGTHSDERTIPCPTCGKLFRNKKNMKNHYNIHLNIKPHVCDFCGKAFLESSTLRRHRYTHTGEKPYACDLCPMRFNQISAMKSHRRIHTGEMPYKCSVCSDSFRQRPSLISHMKGRHPEVEIPIAKRKPSKKQTEIPDGRTQSDGSPGLGPNQGINTAVTNNAPSSNFDRLQLASTNSSRQHELLEVAAMTVASLRDMPMNVDNSSNLPASASFF